MSEQKTAKKPDAAEVPAAVTPPATPAKPKPVAHPHVVRAVEHARMHWAVDIDPEVSLEEALGNPSFLWQSHERFNRGDLIEFRHPPMLDFYAVYMITDIVPALRLVELKLVQPVVRLTEVEPAVKPDLLHAAIEWKGDDLKYCIMLDHDMLSDGHPTKPAAEEWLRNARAGRAGRRR